MSNLDENATAPEPDEPDGPDPASSKDAEPLHPVNWVTLDADAAEIEWLELNGWVDWLRRTYGLPATVIPPLWHRHPELVWELSALHLAWLAAYAADADASAPLGWHGDFAEAAERLREWVLTCGTKLDRDRPTRQTFWPGEEPEPEPAETAIEDRDQDFVQFVIDDVARRAANLAPDEPEP